MGAIAEECDKWARFFIIPRESIRACVELLDKRLVVWRDDDKTINQELLDFAKDVIQNDFYTWPLSVRDGSTWWERLQKLTNLAVAQLATSKARSQGDTHELAKYLVIYPSFYLNESGDDVLRKEVFTINHPKVLKTAGKSKKKGGYVDHKLGSAKSKKLFNRIMAAARLKSALDTHKAERQFLWRGNQRLSLPDIPQHLQDIIVVCEESNAGEDETCSEVILDDRDAHQDNLTTTAHRLSLSDTETDDPVPTPSASRASSPTLTDKGDNSSASAHKLQVTYAVLIASSTETITVDTYAEPNGNHTTELIDVTQELWSWIGEKGYGNIRLADAVELAKKMVSWKDANVVGTASV